MNFKHKVQIKLKKIKKIVGKKITSKNLKSNNVKIIFFFSFIKQKNKKTKIEQIANMNLKVIANTRKIKQALKYKDFFSKLISLFKIASAIKNT